ncbi:hypothetical protein KP509_02G083400 [Ceratopteris richardii]|nr:hypothetical protein KP509_02G083400 [Ceratopteris richardii]KAH7444569.1 hypothetical protein KP509_02G083400 [Ceratopteris richardii]KAH7444571.1 hypothetical protein KP509_02G083400 [Ceratopteris richardii]KAH7444572.1 hypothetical protein KP509_02G083400 [Ceratopteris richardii]
MVGSGLDGIAVLVDHVIRLFVSNKSLHDANRVFNRLTQPTIHTWNALLTAHIKLGAGQRALLLFYMMDGLGTKPDKITFLCALKACSSSQDLDKGRDIHEQITNSVYRSDPMLRNAIIDMYSKCGDLGKSIEIFQKSSSRDIVSWGAMMTGYVYHGQASSALELFERLLHQETELSKVVFLGALKASAILSCATCGRLIHCELTHNETTRDLVISNSVIDMYIKCGLMADATSCFRSLLVRDEVSWGTMIAGFVAVGDPEKALQYFYEMQGQGLKSGNAIFSSLVKACGLVKDTIEGMQAHHLILASGTTLDMVVCSALIDMYVKCEALQEAWNVFVVLPLPDLISWGSIISGCCTAGCGFAALDLFGRMQESGINPDHMIVTSLVKSCGDIASMVAIMYMQHHITEAEMDTDEIIGSALIDAYAKCGYLTEASMTLNGLQNRDHIAYCSVIAGYVAHGHGALALDLFEKMQDEGFEANRVVLLCTLQACGSTCSLYQSRIIHDKIIRYNLELDSAIANTLIDVYSKCGSLETACKLFETSGVLDDVHWGTMLAGYVMHGKIVQALELLRDIENKGVEVNTFMCSSILKLCCALKDGEQGRCVHDDIIRSSLDTDTVLANSLILMYCRQGYLQDAYRVLLNLPRRDSVSWATIIAANMEHGRAFLAMQDFERMQNEGVNPSMAALICTVKACASIGAIVQGRVIHNLVVLGELEKDAVVGSTLVELYSMSGSPDEAYQLLGKLPHHDAAAWGALISGCTHNGELKLARCYFSDMLKKGVVPDSGVFTCLLSSCSQEGLVEEGHWYFTSMKKLFCVSPNIQHYGCIIELLGRIGDFNQAKDFIDMMPIYPDMIIWMSLLTNCRTYTDIAMAQWCFQQLFRLGAVDAACCILMSDIHSEANLWQDIGKECKVGSCVHVSKQPDVAWLNVGDNVHEFAVGDENDLLQENAYAKLMKLSIVLRSCGFIPLLNATLESSLCGTDSLMSSQREVD